MNKERGKRPSMLVMEKEKWKSSFRVRKRRKDSCDTAWGTAPEKKKKNILYMPGEGKKKARPIACMQRRRGVKGGGQKRRRGERRRKLVAIGGDKR